MLRETAAKAVALFLADFPRARLKQEHVRSLINKIQAYEMEAVGPAMKELANTFTMAFPSWAEIRAMILKHGGKGTNDAGPERCAFEGCDNIWSVWNEGDRKLCSKHAWPEYDYQ